MSGTGFGLSWPRVFLAWNVTVLAVLVWLLWLRQGANVIGDIDDPIGGAFPIIVPWAGALGGATKSLMGTVRHAHDWETRWNLWHVARPILGAITGSVAFVLVVVVLKAAGGEDVELQDTAIAMAMAFSIAFLVGYKEQYFLEMVSKVAEVLFATGDTPAPGDVFSLAPGALDFGEVPVNTAATRTATVTVTPGTRVAPLGPQDPVVAQQGNEFTAAAAVAPAALGVTTQDVVVTFSPTAPGTYQGTVTVTVGGSAKTVALRGTGRQP